MIYTSHGYATVKDEKIVTQLSNKKYIKVKKGKQREFRRLSVWNSSFIPKIIVKKKQFAPKDASKHSITMP